MYAQLVPCGTTTDRRAELERVIRGQVIPALRGEPGFAGCLNLVGARPGTAVLIVLWESAEQARRALDEYGGDSRRAFACLAAVTHGPQQSPSVWEVSARV